MRFQVPQFIDVEDKIFGPLTLKQFIYLAGGGGATVILFKILPNFLAFLISAPIVALSLALAFYKVNNRPFVGVVESFTKYFAGEKLYVWKKEDKKINKKSDQNEENKGMFIPRLSDSKLKDLSWSIDVKSNTNENRQGEGEAEN